MTLVSTGVQAQAHFSGILGTVIVLETLVKPPFLSLTG
jgi:hypothetical protein